MGVQKQAICEGNWIAGMNFPRKNKDIGIIPEDSLTTFFIYIEVLLEIRQIVKQVYFRESCCKVNQLETRFNIQAMP